MLELIVYGIVFGSIISLGAIGLTLVYGIVRFANFAHGDLMSTGAYIALLMVTWVLTWIPDTTFGQLSFGWRMLIAFPVAMFVVACVAIAIDRILYQRFRAKKSHAVLMMMSSLGAAFILRMLILIFWGADSLFYRPGILRPALELPLGVKIRPDQILILVVQMGIDRRDQDLVDVAELLSGLVESFHLRSDDVAVMPWAVGGSWGIEAEEAFNRRR